MMEELKQTELKSAFKPTRTDAATLRALIAELNGDKKMTPEEIAENERIYNAELAKAQSVENIPHSAQVAASRVIPTAAPVAPPAAPIEKPPRFFVTGHPGAIANLFDNVEPELRIVSLSLTVSDILKSTCQLAGSPPAAVLTEFRKFGDGEFAPNLTNLFILGLLRKSFPAFGAPGFWVKSVLENIPGGRQAVVSVRTPAEFRTLQAVGFKHFHIMATPGTVLRRTPSDYTGTLSQLSQSLDSDTHKKISVARSGPRLNVVWNDEAAAPSGLFISAKEFKESVLGAAPVVLSSTPVSQIL